MSDAGDVIILDVLQLQELIGGFSSRVMSYLRVLSDKYFPKTIDNKHSTNLKQNFTKISYLLLSLKSVEFEKQKQNKCIIF